MAHPRQSALQDVRFNQRVLQEAINGIRSHETQWTGLGQASVQVQLDPPAVQVQSVQSHHWVPAYLITLDWSLFSSVSSQVFVEMQALAMNFEVSRLASPAH